MAKTSFLNTQTLCHCVVTVLNERKLNATFFHIIFCVGNGWAKLFSLSKNLKQGRRSYPSPSPLNIFLFTTLFFLQDLGVNLMGPSEIYTGLGSPTNGPNHNQNGFFFLTLASYTSPYICNSSTHQWQKCLFMPYYCNNCAHVQSRKRIVRDGAGASFYEATRSSGITVVYNPHAEILRKGKARATYKAESMELSFTSQCVNVDVLCWSISSKQITFKKIYHSTFNINKVQTTRVL